MRLRPYIHEYDFEKIRGWMTDERIHAMWCAGHMRFPLEKDDFFRALAFMHEKYGDCPFVATEADGTVVGFICCSVNAQSNEAMLAFVMIDPALRGKGYGREMIRTAARYCFDTLGADAVQLNVFDANERARKCYESAGFALRSITEDAYRWKDEKWARCNMVMTKAPANELCMIIKDAVKPNFLNIRTSIMTYDRDAVCYGAPCWRWVYHALHSADKWFIDPFDYEEPEFHEEGMDDPEKPCSTVLTDEQLLAYLDMVEKKTYDYLDSLTDDMLCGKPDGCRYTRLELVLRQFRHISFHTGVLNGQTMLSTGKFPMWVSETGKYVDDGEYFGRYRKGKIQL